MADAPDASIVVPTYGRADALAETLECLGRVDPEGARIEIIVVDDGSPEPAAPVVDAARAGMPHPLRLVVQQNGGVARARNRGAREARGARLLFLDNDILVAPDFVSRHLAFARAHPDAWVIGRIVNLPRVRQTPFGRYQDEIWERFARDHAGGPAVETEGMTAANLGLPRASMLALGGFDEGFTISSCEDAELAMRARARGTRVYYDPSIVVRHNDWAVDLPKYCERQRLYAISDVLLWRKYGAASPREALVVENGPLRPGDRARTVVRKLAKGALASDRGQDVCVRLARLAERLAPDTALSRRAYDLAVGVAIVRGVREGLRRYPG